MAFTPFVETDLPTMANFNQKFLDAIDASVDEAHKVATGSYVGTGTYGASNPNTLTFEFEPKLVIIYQLNGGHYTLFMWGQTTVCEWSTEYIARGAILSCSYSGNTMSWNITIDSGKSFDCWWYSDVGFSTLDHASHQLNASNVTYYYTALG